MYTHDVAEAGEAVSTMLQELAQAAHAYVRVMSLEIIVNASLRVQLLLDTPLPSFHVPHVSEPGFAVMHIDDERKQGDAAHVLQREAVEQIVSDLRMQLVRLVAWAFDEQLLDGAMSEASISSILLLCTHNGKWDALVYQHVPLEALAALVTHSCSNGAQGNGYGASHATLLHLLATLVHHGQTHRRLEPETSSNTVSSQGGGMRGFEERVRRVGGIRWLLLQLRCVRSGSCRQLLYSIIMRYVLGAVAEARWNEEDSWGDEGELVDTPPPPHLQNEGEADEAWESACIETVELLDDCAMAHAFAHALWVYPPNFCQLLGAQVKGRSKSASRSTTLDVAAAQAILGGLEQVSLSLHYTRIPADQGESDTRDGVCEFTREEIREVDVEEVFHLLLSEQCLVRNAGVEKLFLHHVSIVTSRACCKTTCAAPTTSQQSVQTSTQTSNQGGRTETETAREREREQQTKTLNTTATRANTCNTCHNCHSRTRVVASEADTETETESDMERDTDMCCGEEEGGEVEGQETSVCVGVWVSQVEYELLRCDVGVCLGLLELTQKLLVHHKMLWAASPPHLRPSLALSIQLLVSHRLQVSLSLALSLSFALYAVLEARTIK